MLQHEVSVAMLVYIVITIIFYVLGYSSNICCILCANDGLFAVAIHFYKSW